MTQYNLKVLVILKISSILGPLRSFKVFWAILFTLIVQGGGGGGVILVVLVISGIFLFILEVLDVFWSFLRFQRSFGHSSGFRVFFVI